MKNGYWKMGREDEKIDIDKRGDRMKNRYCEKVSEDEKKDDPGAAGLRVIYNQKLKQILCELVYINCNTALKICSLVLVNNVILCKFVQHCCYLWKQCQCCCFVCCVAQRSDCVTGCLCIIAIMQSALCTLAYALV